MFEKNQINYCIFQKDINVKKNEFKIRKFVRIRKQ